MSGSARRGGRARIIVRTSFTCSSEGGRLSRRCEVRGGDAGCTAGSGGISTWREGGGAFAKPTSRRLSICQGTPLGGGAFVKPLVPHWRPPHREREGRRRGERGRTRAAPRSSARSQNTAPAEAPALPCRRPRAPAQRRGGGSGGAQRSGPTEALCASKPLCAAACSAAAVRGAQQFAARTPRFRGEGREASGGAGTDHSRASAVSRTDCRTEKCVSRTCGRAPGKI